MSDSAVPYETVIGGGKHWSLTVHRGTVLRLTDLEGGANVGMLFYNPLNPLERYNAPDTLKCQHTFKLTRGHCLYSDMGRIFCSIVADTVGWHDTVAGNANKALVAERWGLKSYQDYRNDWTQNGHDAFMVEAGKYGLAGRRFSRSPLRDGHAGVAAHLSAPDEPGRGVSAPAGRNCTRQGRSGGSGRLLSELPARERAGVPEQ